MRYRRSVRSLLTALVLVATLPLTAVAEATTVTTTERTEQNELIINPCTGELVLFFSEYTSINHVTIDEQTGTHVNFAQSVNRTGFGLTTGQEYVGSISMSGSIQNPYQPAFVHSTENKSLIISKGDTPNWFVFHRSHITVDANGVTRTAHFVFRTECHG